MSPTKILIGQGCCIVTIVVGGLWASTQWTAAMLGNQPGLRVPLVSVLGQPIYAPWRLFEWWYAYEAYAPTIFRRAGMFAAGSGIAGTFVAIVGSLWRARQTKLVTPKVGNRASNSDRAVDFLKPDSDEAKEINCVLLKEVDKKRSTPTQIVQMMNDEGFPKFKISHHTELWQSLDAKGGLKKFDCAGDYKGTWVWYDSWIARVRAHCQEQHVEKKALIKTGDLRHTRYFLKFESSAAG